MKNNNVKKNMNWVNMLVHICGFFGGTMRQPVSARLSVSQDVSASTISYVSTVQFRAGSISNFLRLFITNNKLLISNN